MRWDDYTEAILRLDLPDAEIEVAPAAFGRTEGTFPGEGRPFHIITAYNPGGHLSSADDNALAQSRLTDRVTETALEYYPAAGGDRAWEHVEPSLAVLGLDRDQACALGREFGQDAIFEWSPTGLAVLSCSDARVHYTGWATSPVEDTSAAQRPESHTAASKVSSTAVPDTEPESHAPKLAQLEPATENTTTTPADRVTTVHSGVRQFKERLIATLGPDHLRVVSPDEADILVLSELRTYLIENNGSADGSVRSSLTIRTPVAHGVSASHPDFNSVLWALGQTGGLNRWTYEDLGGVLSLESTLLVDNPLDENLLRLGGYLLRSQVSEARAKLFSGLHDTLGGWPAVLRGADGELLWESEDYSIASFIEDNVRPVRERTDLWESLWDRSLRVLPVPDYAPYQGPGWLGVPTTDGWIVQLPWTSIANDYGVIEIRWDHLLSYSDGETLALHINYLAESPMSGAGLEMDVELPIGSQTDPSQLARHLNLKFAVPTWTHGIGRFVEHDEGVRFVCFLPAYLAMDRDFAAWLFDLVLMTAAITLQEIRPELDGGDPVPHNELRTSLPAVS